MVPRTANPSSQLSAKQNYAFCFRFLEKKTKFGFIIGFFVGARTSPKLLGSDSRIMLSIKRSRALIRIDKSVTFIMRDNLSNFRI
jgi:hypothetical protein